MKLLMIVLLLTCGVANAGSREVVRFEGHAEETEQAYVERMATFLDGWTASTGNEACGIITKQQDRYLTIITTSESQLVCAMSLIAVGSVPTGDTIHSHPTPDALGRVRLTDSTRDANPDLSGLTYFKIGQRMFSEADYRAGPGYLVCNGRLMYQHGKGSSKTLVRLGQNLASASP